ncbi:cysteine-rich small domain-containing protein [Methanococcus aeolicus]|uniref:Cysteine-rich small domain n=1 Tax=Methanococcus aeolicus (strain ATCC BAA-1280 / DSM 17508 / OCM 812 / Nankai-3) TaxID=419665 RepID=A6UVJ2_META3|nr:cysteine-rich small domain-containing protein [Methanococcus aeolicus]ABR56514.1 cysteine-rich small domain [Methanococcus aeolicus Nankai-3]UXM84522.1 hypothetical protein N6C89_07220 [Methanococcus aeolicus]
MLELHENHLKKVFNLCGANRDCEYYPCHYDNQVCLWCYCPFYPCNDEEFGELITRKDGTTIWSCMNCGWVHRPEVASEILKEILKITNDKNIDDAVNIMDNHELMLKIREKVKKKYKKNIKVNK